MAITQSTYSDRMAAAIRGQIANTQTCDVDSYTVERNAATGTDRSAYQLHYGRAAGRSSTEDKACVPGVTVDSSAPFHALNFLGIAVKDPTREQGDDDRYVEGTIAGLLFRGDIWVLVDGAVSAGQDVTIDATTGELGSTAADATHGLLPGARWLTDATDNNIAKVRLSGYMTAVAA